MTPEPMTRYFVYGLLLVSCEVLSANDLTGVSSGAALYSQYCQSCHGTDKVGLEAFDGDLEALKLRLDGYTEYMPDFSGLFSDDEVAAIYAYLVAEDDLVTSASRVAPMAPPVSEGNITTLKVSESEIHLFIEGRPFNLSQEVLQSWVRRSAEIVTQYYGGFPVPEAHVAIRGRRGPRVTNGRAFGDAGAVVNVGVGLLATPETLANDWVLIHELIHLAFPNLPRRHHWIEEGLSVYIESIARANAGDLSADTVWTGFLDGMPKGLPQPGDKGLDYTPTWGRTYWGGALFCLLADVRIREQTAGQKTLRDALRGIVAAGYDITKTADIRTVLTVADQATGVDVLLELYDEMRAAPMPKEIDSLWANLGVARQAGKIIYDDNAPQADIRRALTHQQSGFVMQR